MAAKRLLAAGIAILVAIIVVPLFVLGVSMYRSHQATNNGGEVPNSQIKNRNHSPNGKKKKQIHVKQLSKDQTTKKVKATIPYSLAVITKTQALPGESVSFGTLNQEETKKLYTYYQNGSIFQEFNDIINYSSPEGKLQWGDAGTKGDAQVTTPKPGDTYTLDGGNVEYLRSDQNNYYYEVTIVYHAGDTPQRKAKLRFTVSKVTGVITHVSQIGRIKL